MSLRIKRDDRVVVLSGKEKGKEGKVIKVFPDKGKLIVEGLNRVKKHMRPTQRMRQGGIIEQEMPMHISKVMLLCPNCGQPTRFSAHFIKDRKVRLCKKCKEPIDQVE
jgi:large subunit ribosomal protein L24